MKPNKELPFIKKTGKKEFDRLIGEKLSLLPELRKGEKSSIGAIVWMTPDDYVKSVAECFGSSKYSLREETLDSREVDEYAAKMIKGVKFNIPYLDCKEGNQDGLHRALAAEKIGIKEIPVFMVCDCL